MQHAAEGGPHTYLRQQTTSAETHVRRQGCGPDSLHR